MSKELVQDLIRIKSYSGEEKAIQEFIRSKFVAEKVNALFQGDNLYVHLRGKDSTRAFIFNSHVDVVDAGDESRWEHNPWSGDIVDGRMYGRGASDMKSGVGASIDTAVALSRKEELPCDAWFTYVVREEVDGSGTQEFADWFKKQGYINQYAEMAAIFTEGTNLDSLEYGHRGNFFIKASLKGDAGHSSRPDEIKTHAVLEMTKFISKLERENSRWKKLFTQTDFGPPTITPTSIEAQSKSPNKTADFCQVTFDLRTIPKFHQEAFARVKAIARKKGIEISLLYPEAPTGYTDPKAFIVKVIKQLIPDIKLQVSEGSADLGFMTGLGIEGIIFGPGEKSQDHVINESVPVENIDRAAKLYEQIYYAWASKSGT